MNSIRQALGLGQGTPIAKSAQIIADLLQRQYRPARVADVGCGDGTWLSKLHCHQTGLDRHSRNKITPGSMDWYHRADFRKNWLMPRADLALCLEVAEHLWPADGVNLVAKLCTAPVVVWSAAIPGQGGFGHVNEKWPSYWARLFEERGYYPDLWLRDDLWHNRDILPWYHHIVIYTPIRYRTPELDTVHPRMANLKSFSRLCALLTLRQN